MKNSTTWLRLSYWVGAITDGLVAVAMFSQMLCGHASPLTHKVPDAPYRYAIGLAGSLMLGWTLLLVWADRRPQDRRGVLPLTCIVVIALAGTVLFAISSGHMPIGPGILVLTLQGFLIILFSWSYTAAKGQHR